MVTEKDNRFDLYVRSVLDGAAEEVPEGVWSGIERRLDENSPVRKARIVPLWMRIAGGTAAAAAVAAVMFIAGISDGPFSSGRYGSLADSGENQEVSVIKDQSLENAEIILADIPEALPLDMPSQRLSAVEDSTVPTGSIPSASVRAGTESKTETAGARSAKPSPDTGGKQAENAVTAPEETDEQTGWESLLPQETRPERQNIRTSVTLSGNAISNTNSSASARDSEPMSFRPGRNEHKENMVTESSVSSYSVPVSVGAGVKIDFTKRWSLGVGLNYSMLRRTFAGKYYEVQDNGELSAGDFYSNIMNRQDYIGLPVNVYFSILESNFIDFYAYAGGSVEKCLSNTFRMSAEDVNILHKERVEGFQFSAGIGLGMEFVIARTLGIYIDPSLRYYFPDSRQPRSIRTTQPLMFGLELGFRIRL